MRQSGDRQPERIDRGKTRVGRRGERDQKVLARNRFGLRDDPVRTDHRGARGVDLVRSEETSFFVSGVEIVQDRRVRRLKRRVLGIPNGRPGRRQGAQIVRFAVGAEPFLNIEERLEMILAFGDNGTDRLYPFVSDAALHVRGRKLQGCEDVVVETIDPGRLRFDLDEIVDRLSRRGARHHGPKGSGVLMRHLTCHP